jgi:hypothetical protein
MIAYQREKHRARRLAVFNATYSKYINLSKSTHYLIRTSFQRFSNIDDKTSR